jgi:hypothetical protein
MYRIIDAETCITTTVGYNNKEQWQKTEIRVNKYKEKWKTVRNNEGKVEIKLHV